MSENRGSILSRRDFLRQLGLAAGAAAFGLTGRMAGAVQTQSAPGVGKKGINILFLMNDEHNFKVLGASGNLVAHTPNLDRLAREGVFFESAFVPVPYCSPTRASLISGQYPHRLIASRWDGPSAHPPGILWNIEWPHGVVGTDFPTTEMILYEHGWKTDHRGKWHLGDTGDLPCYVSTGRGPQCYVDEGYEAYFNAHVPPDPGAQSADRQPPRGTFVAEEAPYQNRPTHMTPAIIEARRNLLAQLDKGDIDSKLGPGLNSSMTIGSTDIPLDFQQEGYIAKQVIEKIEEFTPQGNWMITCSFSPPPHALCYFRTLLQPDAARQGAHTR